MGFDFLHFFAFFNRRFLFRLYCLKIRAGNQVYNILAHKVRDSTDFQIQILTNRMSEPAHFAFGRQVISNQ